MIVLGLDFETTVNDKVDPLQLRVIEVGVVLWDTDRKAPLKMSSHLCWGADYPEFSQTITDITGITKEDIASFSVLPNVVLNGVRDLSVKADYIVAHNGNKFDRPLFEAECIRHGIPLIARPWIDTMVDIEYPSHIKTRSLKHLAAEHGFLNPFSHRALFDVMTMLKVMSCYDFREIERRSKAPRIKVQALTIKPWEDNGVSNALAKELGFRFDGDSKRWLREILETEFDELVGKAGLVMGIQRV